MYSESIFETEQGVCFLCGRWCDTARHEIFHGPFRKKSQTLGLWVNLCPPCHDKIHRGGEFERSIKEQAQLAAMSHYDWSVEQFRLNFWKNYV